MSADTTGATVEYRPPTDLYDPRLLAVVAVVAAALAVTMVAQGASHEVLHDARHVAGVACH